MVRHSLYEGGGETGPASLYNKHDDLSIMYTFCMFVCLFVQFGFTLNAESPITTRNQKICLSVFVLRKISTLQEGSP